MIRFRMATTPILAGLLVLSAGVAHAQDAGAAVAEDLAGLEPWEAIVVRQLETAEEHMAPLGFGRHAAPRYDLLRADSLDTALIELSAGVYRAVAVCDGDCTDVDLMVTDAAGHVLGMDVLDDDVPIVDFETAGGQVGLSVKMIRCSTDVCYYGLQLFRKGR